MIGARLGGGLRGPGCMRNNPLHAADASPSGQSLRRLSEKGTTVHTPVNHHLRPLYRVLAAVVWVYVLVFGAGGFLTTRDRPAFDRTGESALGLQTNLGFSVASLVAGAVILLALLIGRNVDY